MKGHVSRLVYPAWADFCGSILHRSERGAMKAGEKLIEQEILHARLARPSKV
jgi:hypothetical protein